MSNIDYSHYIEIDENNAIVGYYMSMFGKKNETDVLLRTVHERKFYFEVGGQKIYSPNLFTSDGFHRYKLDGTNIVERTTEEMETPEIKNARILAELEIMDKGISRGEEDIIDMLIAKEVITENDIPGALKTKYNNKKSKREELT